MRAPIEVRDLVLHGHRVSYRQAGRGPVVLLLHGVAGRSASWEPVMRHLAADFTVIAPDLIGHGESAKPRGDYSLGAFASGVRDVMAALGHDRATVVGHSLGGGIAMQFAYQFPERAERLVLVSSGGLGKEVSFVLRSAALPGAELVLPLLFGRPVLRAGATLAGFFGRLGFEPGADLAEMATAVASFQDAETRRAFLATVRNVIDVTGQSVSATDRLYLAANVPTLLAWGEDDPIIPAAHGRAAHALIPGSRLELYAGAGHFPHLDDPVRFSEDLRDFILSTEPAAADPDRTRELLLAGAA